MVCKHKDAEYFFRLHHYHLEPYWKLILSNGEIIYQDDYNMEYDLDAWQRAQTYCNQHGLKPIKMTVEYYDNIIDIQEPFDGLFFRRGVIEEMFTTDSSIFTSKRNKSFVIGYYSKDTDILHVFTYKVPEMILWEYNARNEQQRIETKSNIGTSLWLL